MGTNLKQIQALKQKLAPKQVMRARLLQLNTVNLEQAIVDELEQNPLLEQILPEDMQDTNENDKDVIDEIDVSIEDIYSDESTYYYSEQKNEMPLPNRNTLLEDLIEQLKDLNFNEEETEIAEEIIWNTNEKGFLDTDLALIADRFELLEIEIEPILHKVQRLEPMGIGSRSLKECLMIQMEKNKSSLSYNLIKKYFDDFMYKRYDKIKNGLNCTADELQEAMKTITQLNPNPGEGYLDKFQVVLPDIIVRYDGNDWIITTNDGGIPELRISQIYDLQMKDKSIKSDAKKFIKEKFDLANMFIDAIHQRRLTMVKVMRSIILFQPEWFAGNVDYLRPLKLQDIADEINMDISTISRSTRGKYADTPYGIFELKYFFTDSIELKNGEVLGTFVIKRALERIIKEEDKHSPLSDDAIVNKLILEGYTLARRTIAKYRNQMGYPVARLRKEI